MVCRISVIEWSIQYGIPLGLIDFKGYTGILPDDICGRCYYHEEGGVRKQSIQIPARLFGKNLLCRIAMWHEFCHAELYVKTGKTGHTKGWFAKTLRKPHLFIGQALMMLVW